MTEEEIRRAAKEINWYHPLQLTPGFNTRPGRVRKYRRRLGHMAIPADLTGWSVLDIGAYDGFFSFECERRGADVVAADSFAWDTFGTRAFDFAREVLASKVRSLHLDVDNFNPDDVGQFDLVLLPGVFYHLRNPFLALERLRRITRRTLIIDTHCMVPAFHERYPIIGFFPGDGKGVPFYSRQICAIATLECLRRMITEARFPRQEVRYVSPWKILTKLQSLLSGWPHWCRCVIHAHSA